MKRFLGATAAGLTAAAATFLIAPTIASVTAAAGDVGNVDFAAPLADSYDHSTGGGFFGDGSNTFVRGELQGDDFACGDVVTFLAAFETAAAPVAATPFAVEMEMRFTTDTTGQSGAALFPIVDSPMINLGDTALVPAEPTAYVDGDATIEAVGDPYTDKAYEMIVFTVAGLEAAQTVVVRVDARIGCPYLPLGDSPTGNLQASLESVFVLDPPNEPADSGTGRQTVNLRRVQNFTNIGEPALLVTKTALVDGQSCPGSSDITVPLGIAVDYCYTVENFGSGPAIDLVLVDDMATPDDDSDDVMLSLDGLTDADGDQNLDDLEEGTATAVLEDVTHAEVGSYTNTATATETAFAVTADATATVEIEDVLSIDKTWTGSGTPEIGESIPYEIVATNTSGTLTLDDVTISDVNATIGTCNPAMPATLAPGDTLTCSATHVVTLDDAEAGSVSNIAEVAATFLGHPVDATSKEVVVEVAPPPVVGLSLAKERIGTDLPQLDDTITYSLVATNTGDRTTLGDVTISDDNATIGTCTPAMPATLAPGDTLTCSATHVVTLDDTRAGSVTNVAEVTATHDGEPVDAASNEVVVPVAAPPVPELTLVKTRVGTGVPKIGDTITYSLVATNTVDRTTLGDVTISDDNATIGTCTPAMPATLAPGDTLTCSATHVVTLDDAQDGSVSNVAEATSTYLGEPVDAVSNEVVVPIAAPPIPELTLVKNRIGNEPVTVGDTITYEITATNTGEFIVLDDIVIVDTNATITSCTREMPATLAPGESITCTAVRVVTAADAASGQITNVASVDGYSAETDVSLTSVASNPVVVSIPQLAELPATGNGRRIAGAALVLIAFGGGLWLLTTRRRRTI